MNLRISIIVLFMSFTAISCTQDKAATKSPSKNNSQAVTPELTAKDWEAIGYKNFNGDHKAAIDAFRQAASKYEIDNNLKSAAIMYTNISNLYRDAFDNKNAAVDYGLKALSNWRKENDQLQVANLLKDIGLLQAETYQTRKAYSSLNEASSMFKRMNNKDALAIVDHNMATAHYIAERYDQAEASLLKSQNHWKPKGTINRIFNNNILAIKIYKDSNQLAKMQAVIEECENMRTYNEINRYAEARYTELIKTL
ncbi:hypothetical protein N9L92_01605 [Saprospiraceae bacterium]|nr:hypothetical protein [Saprospiraceae bacterium]